MDYQDNHIPDPDLGQYFTTDPGLKDSVLSFIKNSPEYILEPAVGRGDLVLHVAKAKPEITWDMIEIDPEVATLPGVHRGSIVFTDFLSARINKKYQTIIGNPPYVRTQKGNLYIDFTRKCYNMLQPDGELIFIVPSDFFRVTSAATLLEDMLEQGTFTHIYHPNNERLFAGAAVDVLVFRYCRNSTLPRTVCYNNTAKHLVHNAGLVIFTDTPTATPVTFGKVFGVYVGLVSGAEGVYKNAELGNVDVIINSSTTSRYILVEEYPTGNPAVDSYLLGHKPALLNRAIRQFNNDNWYQWGALRNTQIMREHVGKPCIYLSTISRKNIVAHLGKVGYFSATLLMLLPLIDCDETWLNRVVEYLNSEGFRTAFTASGRFKIGQAHLVKSYLPVPLPSATLPPAPLPPATLPPAPLPPVTS